MSDVLRIQTRKKDLGGFSVRRVLPFRARKMVGPFIFFDHMGPAVFEAGQGIDVRPHPHINLATVTYLFSGVIRHQDSLGYDQDIRPGDVNWMTAGKGIVHSERSPQKDRDSAGSKLEGIQSWVALPKDSEEVEPSFVHYPQSELPRLERDGNQITLIAGDMFELRSPVKVLSPTIYGEFKRSSAGEFKLPVSYKEVALYVVSGSLKVNSESVSENEMLIFDSVEELAVMAAGAAHFMLIGGEPFPEPRHIWWNFVSSRSKRIEQAKSDWRQQRMGKIEGDNEFIPLPKES